MPNFYDGNAVNSFSLVEKRQAIAAVLRGVRQEDRNRNLIEDGYRRSADALV